MGGVTDVNYGQGPFWVTIPVNVALTHVIKQQCPSPGFVVPLPPTITACLIPVPQTTETLGIPGQWVERDQTSYNDEL